MGYRDYKLMFCDSQTLTAEASDYNIDTELTNPGWEKGTPLEAVVAVETAGSGTTGYNITVVHKATADPSTGDTDLATVRVPIAQLTKGAEIKIRLPGNVTLLRYVGLYFDRINGDESMVASAWLQPATY